MKNFFVRATSILIFVNLFVLKSWAGLLIDTNVGYESSTVKYEKEGSHARTGFGAGIYFQATKKVWIGWAFNSYSFTQKLGAEEMTYSSTEMGPTFKWQLGRGDLYAITATYNLNIESTAKFTSEEKALGSSFLLSFGVQPQVSDLMRVGANLNYYSASHGKKLVGDTQSSVSYSNTWIFPSLAISFVF